MAYFIKVAPLRLGLLPDRSSRDGRGGALPFSQKQVGDSVLYRSRSLGGKPTTVFWRMAEKPVLRPRGLDL